MFKNAKRRYVVIFYIVLVTFFVSILYYGRIYHFGKFACKNEIVISIKNIDDKKKNKIKGNFRNIIVDEKKYIVPRKCNKKIGAIIGNNYKNENIVNNNFKVWVDDKNGDYLTQTDIDIFSYDSSKYHNTTVVTDKIAPGVENTYSFKIHNQLSFGVKYNLKMTETMQYDVNMKYKLKMNGSYVIGNSSSWVEPSQLSLSNLVLNSNSVDNYELEWKWVDSANDNVPGINMNSNYILNVKIDFEEI